MKKLAFYVLVSVLLTACSGRKSPAPIATIDKAGGSYTKSHRNSLKSDKYQVKRGETLYAIAWRAGIDFRHLARINNISKPYEIYPGQVLLLKNTAKISSKNTQSKQPVNLNKKSEKNNKKTVANKKTGEYGKNQADQKDKIKTKKDPFPSKVRRWRYPSEGRIIEAYSSKENGNKGLDFGGNAGDPIIAAADGKVVYAGSALRGYGNLVIVKHNNDYLSAYAHNKVLKVKEQDWVKAGQVIAEMGNSGSEDVRLHFEIRFRGRSVNPLKYLPRR